MQKLKYNCAHKKCIDKHDHIKPLRIIMSARYLFKHKQVKPIIQIFTVRYVFCYPQRSLSMEKNIFPSSIALSYYTLRLAQLITALHNSKRHKARNVWSGLTQYSLLSHIYKFFYTILWAYDNFFFPFIFQ